LIRSLLNIENKRSYDKETRLRLPMPEGDWLQFKFTFIINSTTLNNMLCIFCSYQIKHISEKLDCKHILWFFLACVSPSYGRNCENYCYCFNNQSCDLVSGTCPSGGCQKGWEGISCSMGLYRMQLSCKCTHFVTSTKHCSK
jgi:hypothetical protein